MRCYLPFRPGHPPPQPPLHSITRSTPIIPSPRIYKLIFITGLIVAIGIVSRIMPLGHLLWDKYLGNVLYAAIFYLFLSFLWPTGAIATKATLTAVYVITIEIFQLTSIPLTLNRSENPIIKIFAYVVLGSQFSGWDLLAYAIGIGGKDRKICP